MKLRSFFYHFIFLLLTVLYLLLTDKVAAQDQQQNYIKVWTVTRPGIKSPEDVLQLPTSDCFQRIEYIDGFTRTRQMVLRKASASKKDIIQYPFYDEMGREQLKYLPYVAATDDGSFQADYFPRQADYYHNLYPGENYYYQRQFFENSPLGRTIKVSKPGEAWPGHNRGITISYEFNTPDDDVHFWEIDYSESAIPKTTAGAVYAPGTLSRQVSEDETGVKTISYSDYDGKLILIKKQDKTGSELSLSHQGWICTYYVYDHLNRLRSIITPKAVEYLRTNNWQLVPAVSNALCHIYFYDDRGRVIYKKQPGAAPSEVVYDNLFRPAFTRTALEKKAKRWMVTLYDELNRPKINGFIECDWSREQLQAAMPVVVNNTAAIDAGVSKNGVSESLVVSERENGRPKYEASQSVSVENGFVSEDNAEFEIIINTNAPASLNQQVVVKANPIPQGLKLVTLQAYYYDTYDFAGAKSFDNSFSFPANNNPNTLATNTSQRILDEQTGKQIRIINDDDFTKDGFLTSTAFYDNAGNVIQAHEENYLNGTEVTTFQYDYGGQLLNSQNKKNIPGTAVQNFLTGTTYEYSSQGDLMALYKSYNGQPYKKLLAYSYDDLREHRTIAQLLPEYNSGAGLEALQFSYTVQGWLEGINKDYALSTSNSSQWDHYWGELLGYEKAHSGIFTNPQFNGDIGGTLWKSQGDNKPRRYNYFYSKPGFLTKAGFEQRESPVASEWTSNEMDVSMPLVQYDENGNITVMQQKGLVPGATAPVTIDDLSYKYEGDGGLSNKLKTVTDNVATGNLNGTSGDFKNGVNLPASHYTYDEAGNVVNDYNKGLFSSTENGILYNILNKSYKTTVSGKYELSYVYDAEGRLLARKAKDLSVAAGEGQWKYYINDLVLSDNQPLWFSNEAGRLRVSKVTSAAGNPAPSLTIGGNEGLTIGGKPAFYDVFLTDHQGSTRAVLTTEEHAELHMATAEISNSTQQAYEERFFGKVNNAGAPDAGNELIVTRDNIPQAWGSHYNDPANKKANRLSKTNPVGPNSLFKVMAGDVLNAKTDYFYNEAPGDNAGVVNNVVNSLVSALVSSPASGAGVKDFGSQIQSQLLNSGDLAAYMSNPDNGSNTTTIPKAYLNWLFFDENLRLIPFDTYSGMGSGAERVKGSEEQAPLVKEIKVPCNGYAFLYVSNSSNGLVWFDNLTINHIRGRLLQENHYYPYGLQIAALSSKAQGKLETSYLYQAAYSEFEPETGLNNFALRTYNPQIGRWMGIDPFDQFASDYIGMGGDPVNNVDPTGGFLEPVFVKGTIKSAATSFANSAAFSTAITYAATGFFDWYKDARGNYHYDPSVKPGNVPEGAEYAGTTEYFNKAKGVTGIQTANGVIEVANTLPDLILKSSKPSIVKPSALKRAVAATKKAIVDEWNNFWEGKGYVYGGMEWFNRNLNPLVDVYHLVVGRDYVYGTPVSRIGAANKLTMAVVGGKVIGAAMSGIGKVAVGAAVGDASGVAAGEAVGEVAAAEVGIAEGAAANGGIQLTKKTFGHTFTTHGDDMTNFLINRAKGSDMAQGQFLNNQEAARFILDNLGKTANGAVNIPIPTGFPARVILPDGTFKLATHIRLVPSGGGVKTAYPLIP